MSGDQGPIYRRNRGKDFLLSRKVSTRESQLYPNLLFLKVEKPRWQQTPLRHVLEYLKLSLLITSNAPYITSLCPYFLSFCYSLVMLAAHCGNIETMSLAAYKEHWSASWYSSRMHYHSALWKSSKRKSGRQQQCRSILSIRQIENRQSFGADILSTKWKNSSKFKVDFTFRSEGRRQSIFRLLSSSPRRV